MHITLIVITIVSLTLAATMSVVTWRLTREERRRSAARVAALATEIHGEAGTVRRFDDELELRQTPIPSGHSNLFAAADPAVSPASRFAAVVALGIFVVGTGAALAVVLSSGPFRQFRADTGARRVGLESDPAAPTRRPGLHRSNLSRSSSWRSVTSGMPIGSPFAVWSGTRRRAPEKEASRRSSSCSSTMAGSSPADARQSTSRRLRRARNHPSS